MSVLLAAVVVLAAPIARAQPPTGATDTAPVPTEDPPPLVVEVVDLPPLDVLDELRLRLPAREIVTHDAPRSEPPIAYAIVRRKDAGLRMTLIMPSGAAYDRDVADVPDQSVRAAAGALATLIDSVESGRVAPSRTQVPIPPPPRTEPKTETEPEPEPPPEPPPERAPEPEPPATTEPEPEPEPERPGVEVGLALSPGVGLGVAPATDAPVVLGGGGALGVDVRVRSGALVAIEARGLGRTSEGLGLVRLRVAAGGGYAWRRGAFELPIAALVSIEPWWVRRDGAGAPLQSDGEDRSMRPLVGGALRVSPGLFVPRKRPRMPSIRVGARADLSAAFIPDDGAHTVEIAVQDAAGAEAPAVRLGGLELFVGLDLTLWFALGQSR